MEISGDSVRKRVAFCVENEDKHKPLSDQKIVGKKEEGIDVSRRTIAKYRQIQAFLLHLKENDLINKKPVDFLFYVIRRNRFLF